MNSCIFRVFLSHAQQMQDQPSDMSLSRNNADIDMLSSTFTEKNIAFHPRCEYEYFKYKYINVFITFFQVLVIISIYIYIQKYKTKIRFLENLDLSFSSFCFDI